MRLEDLRKYLPVTHNSIYMNTGWAGPTLLNVLDHISTTLAQEVRLGPGSAAWINAAQRLSEDARGALADFTGVNPEDLLITHSTREGINIILHGIKWQPGDELVISNLEHIALTKPAELLAQRWGVRAVSLDVSPQADDAEILKAVRSAVNPRTRMVALSHIQFSCGLRMPVKDIAQIVHQGGGLFLVDGAQSIGQIAVDVEELGCDFYTVSGQKWLMGPVGAAALYIRRSCRSKIEPLFTGKELDSDLNSEVYTLDRFALASHNPAIVAGLAEAVRVIADIGIHHIEERIMMLTSLFREHLASLPISLLTPNSLASACGLVTIMLDGWSPGDLVEALWREFAIIARSVDSPEGVRFSIAPFNTEQEIETVAKALKKLSQRGYSPT